jgi:predicted DCC family thiol-disulfide oxidoreductase YuxK
MRNPGAPAPDSPVLLYDGYCGLCDRAVQWVLVRDRDARFRFATLQGRFADGLRQRHPGLAGVDSLVLVTVDGSGRERVNVRSDAALGVARELPGWSWFATLAGLVPRVVRDATYDLVARSRFRWFGRLKACRIPAPDERARFITDPVPDSTTSGTIP